MSTSTAETGARPGDGVRRVTHVAALVLFMESVFYGAIVPLLPYYQNTLGASKGALGILVGAYPAGVIVGAAMGGPLASRLGVRSVAVAGVTVLAASTAAFGWATALGPLDTLRALQGIGAGWAWGGFMGWVVAATEPVERGRRIGKVFALAIAGGAVGPAFGALALAAGTGLSFSVTGLALGGLAAYVATTKGLPPAVAEPAARRWWLLTRRPILLVIGLLTLPAAFLGAFEVLIPLRLAELGAGTATITVVFVIAAATEAAMAPIMGRIADRSGRRTPIQVGLLVAPVTFIALAAPTSATVLGVVAIVAWGAVALFWVPGTALLSDEAGRLGLGLVTAWSATTITLSGGILVGSAGGAALAERTSDLVIYVILAAACLVFAAVARPLPGGHCDARERPRTGAGSG